MQSWKNQTCRLKNHDRVNVLERRALKIITLFLSSEMAVQTLSITKSPSLARAGKNSKRSPSQNHVSSV